MVLGRALYKCDLGDVPEVICDGTAQGPNPETNVAEVVRYANPLMLFGCVACRLTLDEATRLSFVNDNAWPPFPIFFEIN